jgi:hypothetical protein
MGDAMPPQEYDDCSSVHSGAQVYEDMDDSNGYTALGVGSTFYASAVFVGEASADSIVGDAMPPQEYDDNSNESLLVASKAADGAEREHGTVVSNTVAVVDGRAQVYEEVDDPNGYTALGVGSTVYATVAESLNDLDTYT